MDNYTNYKNILNISRQCFDNSLYNFNTNPLPINKVKDLYNNKRLNAIHKALYYYILFIKDK